MNNQLGDLIREKRKALGISQESLAKLVDYDRSNLLNIEAGKKSAPDDLLERIAKELNVPYKRLLALKMLDRLDIEVKRWILGELLADPSLSPMPSDICPSGDP